MGIKFCSGCMPMFGPCQGHCGPLTANAIPQAVENSLAAGFTECYLATSIVSPRFIAMMDRHLARLRAGSNLAGRVENG